MGHDVEIARRAASDPGLALAGEPDAAALPHAGGDTHAVTLHLADDAGAMTGLTGIIDHDPAPATDRARLRDRKHSLALGLDPATVALGAGPGSGARLGSRAFAGCARILFRNRDRHLCSADRLVE